jgi:NodT family efflux transporter outer membrane factor (OMF) lipoprotein
VAWILRSSLAAAALAGLGLLIAGCKAVGPDYVAPKPSVPASFAEAGRTPGQVSEAPFIDQAWWKNFGDTPLDTLIVQALQSAPDLAEAQARVREARALQGIAGAGRYPTADAVGEYTRNLGSENVPTGVPPGGLGPGVHSNLWQAGFDASWEIDLFGGIRRTIEAANANYQAVAEDRADVTLTLVAEVARDYIELRGAQRRLEVAQKNLAIDRDLLALTRSLLTAGLAPQQDLLRAEAQVRDIQAAIPALETDERAAAYRIAALIDRPATEVSAALSVPRPIPQSASEAPVGLPSELLKRRPDVRAAERRIAAANARIGVAQADLYPHFSLTGVAGLESLYFSSFGNASSGYYQIGPGVTWRIFDAGKIRFEVQAESARTAAATAAYERSVLDAFRDVQTALVSYANTKVRRNELAAESTADAEATDIAKLLYARGVESFLPVLDAERSLYAADDALAQSERDSAIALIALYKSLGGGWPSASAEMSISESH